MEKTPVLKLNCDIGEDSLTDGISESINAKSITGRARTAPIKIQNSEGVSSAMDIKSVIELGQCRKGGGGEVKGEKETPEKSGRNRWR